MLSLGVTLVVSLSAASPGVASTAGVTCADEPTSHLAGWVAPAGPDGDEAEGPVYATPAEVECPTPAPGAALLGDATCDETPPPDLWYRVSSPGASEHASGAYVAARRGHSGRPAVSAGTPVPDHRQVTAPDFQPVALFALPALPSSSLSAGVSFHSDTPPARILAPPDEPPRV
jgi:hypothetical protein